MSVHDSYLGIGEEIAYGVPVTATRFLEMVSEGIEGKYERIESESWRAGQRVLRADRFTPNPKGAEGDIKLEVLDATMGVLFAHALGAAESTEDDDGFTTHTFTVADLRGRSLTVQAGRVDSAGRLHPFTYAGGKVTSWELASTVDGVLGLTVSLDFASEHVGAGPGAFAVSSPVYAPGTQVFTFLGGIATVDNEQFSVGDITIKGDNGLKTDRWFNGGLKKEPLEEGLRKYEWEFKGEFDSLSHANRVASLLSSGALADVRVAWSSPQGGALSVTMPAARFDEGPVNFDGAALIEQSVKGMALDGGTPAVSVIYRSKDTAP